MTMTKTTFKTEADIARLKAVDGRDTVYSDDQRTGLRVRVSGRTGLKSYMVELRIAPNRPAVKKTIGAVDDMPLKEARRQAAEHRANNGRDLVPPPPAMTMAALIAQYKVSATRSRDTVRMADQIAAVFGQRDPVGIRTIEWTQWHRSIARPHTADKSLDVARAILNFGMTQELIPFGRNATKGVKRNFRQGENERHYFWTAEEVSRFEAVLDRWESAALTGATDHAGAAARDTHGRILAHTPGIRTVLAFRLLYLTGWRLSEALTLELRQQEGSRVHWRNTDDVKKLKVKRKTTRTLSSAAVAVLDRLRSLAVEEGSAYFFPGREPGTHRNTSSLGHVWQRLRGEAGLKKEDGQWARIHDLRHHFGDRAYETLGSEKSVMRLMDHSSTRVSARYSKGSDEFHAANAEAVGKTLLRLVVDNTKPDEAA